jgi:imidazolonepropionase-like amidohydrolase
MKTRFLALFALLAPPAFADTLVTNANGIQVSADGKVDHFNALLIGDDGKVQRLLHDGEARPKVAATVDAGGKALLPGLIDAHGHVMGLGLQAIQLDLTGSASLRWAGCRFSPFPISCGDAGRAGGPATATP